MISEQGQKHSSILFGVNEGFERDFLSLDEKFLQHPESVFYLRAQGDAMAPEIKDKDILVVDRSLVLLSGMLAAVFFNHTPLVREYYKNAEGIFLKSFNPEILTKILPEDELVLFGPVKAIVRECL